MAVLGVGVDAVEIARIRTAVGRTPSLLQRLYTGAELAACSNGDGVLRHEGLAGRFAAKEAVAKAFGTGIRGFGWRDVEVVSDIVGRPSVRLHEAAAAVAARLGVESVHLSLTHTRELAIAQVVLEGGR